MPEINISDLKPNDRNKIIELKVYRKWINRNPPNPTPTGYCCILLDKLGHAIQANMDFNDMEYFDHLLQQDSAYKISNFLCESMKVWQQTLPNTITLRFGKFTKFESMPNDGFPEHYFRFISYNQLFRRLQKGSILTDYIASIQQVGELKELGDPNRNQIIKRTIDLINLNGNTVEFTLWDEMAINFDEDAYKLMEKPVIVAVSSCRVTKYGEVLQLSATPATHYYMNPNIPEAEQSREEYKARFDLNPTLQIEKQRFHDKDKEKTRNRYPLATLLSQNADNYKSVRFTCEGTIVDILTNREWYYTTCTMCNKKLTNGTTILQCRDHGPQPKPNYRFCFKAFMTDNSTTAAFTFFSPGADNIIQIECNKLVKDLEFPDPYKLPPAIQAIKEKKHIFQFHFNPLSRGSNEFIFDDILDDNRSPIRSSEPITLASTGIEKTESFIEKKHVTSTTQETKESQDEQSGTYQLPGINTSTPPPYSSQTGSSTSHTPQPGTTSAKRMLFPKTDDTARGIQTKKKKTDATTTKEKEE